MKPLRLQLLQNGQVLGEWSVDPGETVVRVMDPETGRELGRISSSGLGVGMLEPELEEEPELTLPIEESVPAVPDRVHVASAELWVRSSRGWQKRGMLRTGQKATYGSATIRLRQAGELVVHPGALLSGGAELPSGGDLQISQGDRSHSFPPGTSVILTDVRGFGVFVKSRLGDRGFREVVERTGQSIDDSREYEPPISDLDSFSEDTRG